MTVFNHNSFLFSAAFLFVVLAVVLLRDGYNARDGFILVALAFALLALWLVVRPKSGEQNGLSVLDAQRGQGVPLLLELQSPF